MVIKKFYIKSFLFWFVLLITALINATARELTYKPLLTPYIGIWAHQISALTGILLFFIVIYIFLTKTKYKYSQKDLLIIGIMWLIMTVLFKCFMNSYIRHLSVEQVLQTYYFWKGDLWAFVLLSLIVIPQIIYKLNRSV